MTIVLAFAFLQAVLTGAIRSGTSIFYAALGEVIVQRAGIVNLGLEGCMLVGACAGFVATARTGNAFVGLLVAALAGVREDPVQVVWAGRLLQSGEKVRMLDT